MLEIVVGIAVCVAMYRIADADDESGILWFFITFGLCIAALAIPLIFLRFMIAGVASFILLIFFKMSNQPRG